MSKPNHMILKMNLVEVMSLLLIRKSLGFKMLELYLYSYYFLFVGKTVLLWVSNLLL